jgi:hypothetical protein
VAVAKRLAVPMVATRAGSAVVARPGRLGARPPGRPLVAGLPLPGGGGQLGVGGAQPADLAGGLGGQLGAGDRGVIAVQLECGPGGGQPLLGSLGALVTGRCGGQHPLQPGTARGHQGMGVRPALQHGQLGLAELAGQGWPAATDGPGR